MRLSRAWLVWVAQPLTIAVVLLLSLAGHERTFDVPVNNSPGAIQTLVQAKTTLDHGWWWTNPSLGAPSGFHAVLLPNGASVDQFIIRVLGVVMTNVAGVVNLAWLLMLMMAGGSTAWCLRRLGASVPAAWVAGVLFALCPYTLYQNIDRPAITPYLVPFAATAAIGLATNAWDGWSRRERGILLVGNGLLGLNGLDYAYFGAFFTIIGVIAGAVRARKLSYAARTVLVPAAIVLTAAIHLMPTVFARQRESVPDDSQRLVIESEQSGLKIRHLVGPLPDHWLRFLGGWNRREHLEGFPYESENQLSKLGMVGTVGFIGLLAALLIPAIAGPSPAGDSVHVASRLNLAGFLLGTVAGLGTLVSLWISPWVYAYSRITPFIVFFSLLGVVFWLDRATEGRRRSLPIWAALLTFGLLDQMVAVRPLHNQVARSSMEFRALHALVGTMEQRLPPGAMVFQLPIRPYPYDTRVVRFLPYDLFRPYLVSHHLRWSYPALTDAQVRDEAARSGVAPAALAARLAQDGFSAVLIDRYGYRDNADVIVEAIRAAAGRPVLDETERYIALDLRR